MLDILQYDFMIRALLAGLLVAFLVPLLGTFLVARRYALIADSLAHVSLAGVGIGLLAGVAPLVAAVPVAIAGAVLLEWLRQRQRMSGDIALAIVMSGGLALAVVLANLAEGGRVDFATYLFGSIATTTSGDVAALLIATVVVGAVIAWQYRALVHIAFDEDSARIAGYRVDLLNYVLVGLTAGAVVLSLQVVGGLLVSALLVMPVITASRLARSFWQTITYAIAAAVVAVVVGLVVAFYSGVATGGAIVLTALSLLMVAWAFGGRR